ncbi:MAG TPA: hypothetical protein VF215_05930 [Thermoanaerobaculia bacterium]
MKKLLLLALACAVLGCRSAVPLEPPEPEDKGEARERWFYEQRAYPFDAIPADARRAALAQLQRERPSIASEAAATSTWRVIGPQPVGTRWPWSAATGRVKALAISPANPDIVLAGSSSGGIWRSIDRGQTFVPVTDDQADLAVGSIAFAPSDPNIVFAAMGSDFLGTGVLRSDDAGAHWHLVSGASYGTRGTAPRMIVDPVNPNRLWVAQYSRLNQQSGTVFSSGILASEDGGVSWATRFAGLTHDLVALPGGVTTFLAGIARDDRGGGGNAGIYRSINGGVSWSLVVDAGEGASALPSLAVTPAAPQRVYSHMSIDTQGERTYRFLVSNDGGATFVDLPAVGLPHERSVYTRVDPRNADVIYVGLRDLYRSNDGGLTFTNLTKGYTAAERFDPAHSTSHVDQHSIAFHPTDGRILYIGNDGGVFRSEDRGETFTSLSGALSLVQAYGIAAHPTDPATLFLGTQDNGLERRDANGQWRELITGDYGSILFDSADPDRFATNYVRGYLMEFGDRGESYINDLASNETFGEGETQRIAFIAPFEQSLATNTLYFGTYRLFASHDFGSTWNAPAGTLDMTKGSGDTLSAIGVSETHANVLYTGSNRGRVMMTRDAGLTWTDVTTGLPNRAVRAIALDRANADIAYVAFSGYAAPHVWKTRNGGATWEKLDRGLVDTPVNALLIDPSDPNVVYAGTDLGIFRLDDTAAQWEYFSNGLPPVIVTDFAVRANGTIVVATHGRGAYELVQTRAARRRGVRH